MVWFVYYKFYCLCTVLCVLYCSCLLYWLGCCSFGLRVCFHFPVILSVLLVCWGDYIYIYLIFFSLIVLVFQLLIYSCLVHLCINIIRYWHPFTAKITWLFWHRPGYPSCLHCILYYVKVRDIIIVMGRNHSGMYAIIMDRCTYKWLLLQATSLL